MASILVIDDSEADQFIFWHICRNKLPEIKIFQAFDGEEALHLLDEFEAFPELILVDINMPRMNGFEFIAEFEKKYNANISKIIVFSSSNRKEDNRKAKEFSNVIYYLEKPLNDESIEKIKSFL